MKFLQLREQSQKDFRFQSTPKKLSKVEEQQIYYSSWLNAAVHFLITIPRFQDFDRLKERLNISTEQTLLVLNILKDLNLASQSGSIWTAKSKNLHLPADSPLTAINHSHWRYRSLSSLSQSDSLHYSSLYTMSLTDCQLLKQMILDFIQQTRKIVEPSVEEELYCFNCDLFKV